MGLTDDPKWLRETVAILVEQADALPKGDPERRRLLELAQWADQWAETMEARQQWDEEEAAMYALERQMAAAKQKAQQAIPQEMLEQSLDIIQESLPFQGSPAKSTKDR